MSWGQSTTLVRSCCLTSRSTRWLKNLSGSSLDYKKAKALLLVVPSSYGLPNGSLCYLFEVPALVRKLTKWLIILSEFDIVYSTQQIIKGWLVA